MLKVLIHGGTISRTSDVRAPCRISSGVKFRVSGRNYGSFVREIRELAIHAGRGHADEDDSMDDSQVSVHGPATWRMIVTARKRAADAVCPNT